MQAQHVGVDDDWNYVHNLMYAIANLDGSRPIERSDRALRQSASNARGQLENTLYPWSPRDAISRLDPRLPVALRAADWTAALELLKSSDPPASLPNLQFLARQLTQFALGMQALDAHDLLSQRKLPPAQFDAELWRISNRLKDEEDAKSKEKRKRRENSADAAPPKLQLMPDAMPKPLRQQLIHHVSGTARRLAHGERSRTTRRKNSTPKPRRKKKRSAITSLLPTFGPSAKPKPRPSWPPRTGPPQRPLTKRRSSSGPAQVFRSTASPKPASKPATPQQPPPSTPNFWLHGNPPTLIFRN